MTAINTFRTVTPTCPHCGYAMNDDDMLAHDGDLYAIAPNEGEAPIECPSCNKEYWVQGGYRPEYTSAFSEEELE